MSGRRRHNAGLLEDGASVRHGHARALGYGIGWTRSEFPNHRVTATAGSG